LMYWNGPTNTIDPTAGASVFLNGMPVTGTNIGFSSANCWNYLNSQSWKADVTSIVAGAGNGVYSLSGFGSGSPVDSNGVSIIVSFDDGNDSNNEDVVIFSGNDGSYENEYDANGWNIVLSGINYSGGSALFDFHVGDGQSFTDGAIVVNSVEQVPIGSIFDGVSVPGPYLVNGNLWDIKQFDFTSSLSTASNPNTVNIVSAHYSDCLAEVAVVIRLPAGSAVSSPVGQCTYISGCTSSAASNFNVQATVDDGSCHFNIAGCTDSKAINFNPSATVNDGSCTFPTCAMHLTECPLHYHCVNVFHGTLCACNVGFVWTATGCMDRDECTDGSNKCSPNADCANTIGSYTCTCKAGFVGKGRVCTSSG